MPLLEGREGLLPFSSIELALWTFAASFHSPFSFFQEKGVGGMSWFHHSNFSPGNFSTGVRCLIHC